MTLQFRFPKPGKAKAPRLWKNKSGNIAIITALMMIPLTFALGMAYDYTMAEARQDQINGMADVATLAGVTPNEMGNTYTAAQAFSDNLFMSQIATVNGVVSMSRSWTACPGYGDVASGVSVNRTMCVSYTAGSQNVFAKLLGMDTFPLKGSSTATSSTAPNVDFYLLMDTSPSMEIAATTAGMTTMTANTQQESDNSNHSSPKTDSWTGQNWPVANAMQQGPGGTPGGNGCTFGCHQSDPSDLTGATTCASHIDPATPTKPAVTTCQFLTSTYQQIKCTAAGAYADGTSFSVGSTFPESGRDNYDLSRCLGVTLRIDLLNTAAQNLMTTAATTAVNDHATYRMAIYVTDYNGEPNPLALYQLQTLTPDLAAAKVSAAKLQSLEMCNNNNLACGDGNGDKDTDLDSALGLMNTTAYVPNPGTGTNNAGDTPQEVMFIVTDGLNDKTISGNRAYPPIDTKGAGLCTAIKNRNIKIAVLYTTNIPQEETWYESSVEPYLGYSGRPTTDKIATAAQNCASTGLYYEVGTDGDVSAALVHLFQEAIAQARLLH
jgi:Flp pilus assembly protein TadG